MRQIIDVSKLIEGKNYRCSIVGGVYASRRWDCGCLAKLMIGVIGKDGRLIYNKSLEVSDELPPRCEKYPGHCYRLLKLTITDSNIIASADKIELQISTRDKQFMRGHYAARFTDMFVRVIPCDVVPTCLLN